MSFFIFGAGNIAQIAYHYFAEDFNMVADAFVVDDQYAGDQEFEQSTHSYPPITRLSDFERAVRPSSSVQVFVALSYRNLNQLRVERCQYLEAKGYALASYVSPRATILTRHSIGSNAFIFEGNTVQPFVKIGNYVTLWSGNHIGHHSTVEDGVFVSSHVVVSGNCLIRERSFLGVNSTLGDSVEVGREVVVGAGAVVTQDLADLSVVVPARSKLLEKTSKEINL